MLRAVTSLPRRFWVQRCPHVWQNASLVAPPVSGRPWVCIVQVVCAGHVQGTSKFWTCGDAVPTHVKSCDYWAPSGCLICQTTKKMILDKSKNLKIKCWLGIACMQRQQQETPRHRICGSSSPALTWLLVPPGLTSPQGRSYYVCMSCPPEKKTCYFRLHSQGKSCMAKPLLGVWETSGLHELFLRWVGRKHHRQGSQLPLGRWPSSHTALWLHCQPTTTGTQPADEGHGPHSPLCLSGASVMAKSWFWFWVEGRRAITKCEVISSSFAWKCCEELLADPRKRDNTKEGSLPKYSAVQLTGSKHYARLFPGGVSCRESSFVWEEGLTGVVWWIVWKVPREQLKRGKGRQTLLAFFHFSLGNWKRYLWNPEATINSWRETRCSKHFVPDRNCSKFCSLQTKSEEIPNQSSK